MKYKLNFGTNACVMPADACAHILRAGLCDMRVLAYLCSVCGNCDINGIAQNVGFSKEEVIASLSFWRGAGVVMPDGEPDLTPVAAESVEIKPTEVKVQKKVTREAKLPQYTSEQLTDILEGNEEMALIIDECQNILGKILNVHEINVLIGLMDYLCLDSEYILLLVKHCSENGKRTLHYIEKTAFGLYDEGIHTSSELIAELSRREAAMSAEGKIRSIFGIGTRKLTTREKKEISAWVNDMKLPMQIIEMAYEITVDATSQPTLHYANTVLERWHSEGLDTVEKIKESYKDKKDKSGRIAPDAPASFDTDEFFDAAVKKSLGEQ